MLLQIRNFRGVEFADIEHSGPVSLIAGVNGAGKTSTIQAMQAAISGRVIPLDDVPKSSAGMLVRGGNASAEVTLTTDGGTSKVTYPDATRSTEGEPVEISTVAAGLESIVNTPKKNRAQLLGKLLNTDPSAADLAAELGMSVESIAKIWTNISAQGWDAAHAHAKETGAGLKGQWRQIANEMYGSDKAENWLPKNWESDLQMLDAAVLSRKVAEEEEWYKIAVSETAVDGAEQVRLQGLAAQVPALRAEIAKLTAEHDDWERKGTALEKALKALPSPNQPPTMACPHCAKPVQLDAGKLIAPAILSAEEIAARTAAIDNVMSELELVGESIGKIFEDRMSKQTLLSQAERAAADLAKLSKRTGGSKDSVAECTTRMERARNRLAAFNAHAEASRIHQQVIKNQKIIDVLAPDGLRQKKLTDGLTRLNAKLSQICQIAGWRIVEVKADTSISFGGTAYMLASRSEQFRVGVSLQMATALLDKSTVLLIDEVDMLDPTGRMGLVRLLVSAHKAWGMSAILGMTAGGVDKLPDLSKIGGRVYWIEGATARLVPAHAAA